MCGLSRSFWWTKFSLFSTPSLPLFWITHLSMLKETSKKTAVKKLSNQYFKSWENCFPIWGKFNFLNEQRSPIWDLVSSVLFSEQWKIKVRIFQVAFSLNSWKSELKSRDVKDHALNVGATFASLLQLWIHCENLFKCVGYLYGKMHMLSKLWNHRFLNSTNIDQGS